MGGNKNTPDSPNEEQGLGLRNTNSVSANLWFHLNILRKLFTILKILSHPGRLNVFNVR